MIRAILTDFSHVLLFARDGEYKGSINALYDQVRGQEEFDFWSVFLLNEELLEFYSTLNSTIPVHIFTTGKVQNDPAVLPKLEEAVTAIYSANVLGLSKKDEAAYTIMCEKIGYNPANVLYIDDKEEHVQLARAAGLQSFQFVSNNETLERLRKLVPQA